MPDLETKRITRLDSLKGFAMLSVIFGHSLLGVAESGAFPGTEGFLRSLLDFISAWHMPLFLSISGFSFALSMSRTPEEQRRKKTVFAAFDLFLTYAVFQLILLFSKFVLGSFVNHPVALSDIPKEFFLPDNIMWYVLVLVLYYLISLIPLSDAIRTVLLVPLGVLSVISEMYLSGRVPLSVLDFCRYLFFFEGGKKLFSAYKKGVFSKKTMIPMSSLAFAAGVFALNFADNGIATFAFGVVTVIFLFSLFLGTEREGKRIVSFIGENSLVFYLLHTYIVTALRFVMTKTGFFGGISCSITLFVLSVAILSVFTYFLMKTKRLRLIFRPLKFVRSFYTPKSWK